jgi:hypothetical protein
MPVQAGHAMPAEIGNPSGNQALRQVGGSGSGGNRPTVNDHALND